MKPVLLSLFLFLFCFSANADNDDRPRVNVDSTGQFVTYISPFYALSWCKDFPMMSYFNIESGGRSTHYTDRSLLRPGLGGVIVKGDTDSFAKSVSFAMNGKDVTYSHIEGNEDMECRITPAGSREFNITFKNTSEMIEGEFFRMCLAPDVSPVSLWASKVKEELYPITDRPAGIYNPQMVKYTFKLPAVLHFPDYGLVRVTASSPDVYIQEFFLPDYENTGLSLGPFNRGGHVWRKSINLGSVVISFHSENRIEEASLFFSILKENYPHLEGCEMTDSRFNGLKRCWQNSFTVNPVHQSMGDNILLEGIGHLSLMFKAEMLPFTPELDTPFSMKDALRNSIEIALKERIGPDDRIRDFGWESTESTLISLYYYLLSTDDWNFVLKYKTAICRLVRGVLSTDVDKDGIFESPFDGNCMRGNRESFNWWDDFAFGHKDAYVNILAYKALNRMRQVFAKAQWCDEVDVIDRQLERFKASFDKVFYNPATGMYAGWISKDGRVHDYKFTFISSMAINENLVEERKARKILNTILKSLRQEQYDFVYGIPGPLVPVAKEDKGSWDEMTRWGRYENGGLCGQTAYHFIQALYHVGMKEEADSILFTMMATYEREYTHSGVFPGYLQSVDWRTKGGAPCGYNYLADNYFFLLAAITGHFGVEYPAL